MQITLTISKPAVMREVAQTAEYTGDKMTGDDGAYDRIRIVDENSTELNRFWDECRSEIAQSFARMLVSESMSGDNYNLVLEVSSAFDTALQPSMTLGLFSYFVQSIAGRWYVYSNKGEAGAYADRGSALLEEVREKAFFKKKPARPYH